MRRLIAPWAALAGSLSLTLVAAAFVRSAGLARNHTRFARSVRTTEDRIASRIELHATLLRSAAAMLAADPAATAESFRRFVDRLDLKNHYPGVQGIGFARSVRRVESGLLEAELQKRFAGVRIWPDLGGEERTAIVWLEPLDQRNRAAIGYDMFTDPVRRETMIRARDQSAAALSAKVTLVQDSGPGKQAGFLLYAPVYRDGTLPATLAERRSELIGWTYSAFRAGDFFAGIFGSDVEPVVRFRIYDGDGEAPERLLHDTGGAEGRQHETVHMQVAGRSWTVTFASIPSQEAGSAPAIVAALLGAALSGLLFVLALREVTERERAEHAVAELRRSLDERARFEERLREEGRVNSILRRLGISLAAELDPGRLAQLVADEGAALTGAQVGAIFDGSRHLLAVSGALAHHSDAVTLREDNEVVRRTLREMQPARVADLSTPLFEEGGAQVRAVLTAPVVSRTGEVLAGIFFAHAQPGHFTDHHERLLLGLAAQASIALDNARLLSSLQEADRRKDEFLAVLGHELRNPLAPVVTALEVARRHPESRDRQLNLIERQTRHMVRIVDDLLDVARISRGKIDLRRHPVEVGEALSRAAESVLPLSQARSQTLTVVPPAEPLVVDADPVRLDQILGNLLSNAIKYTPPGGSVQLCARRRGEMLAIEVRDDGIGIPLQAQASLFDPFVQLPGAKDYSTGGLGIGLALVRGLVELHGGQVAVQSEGAGKGSVFTVTLPSVHEGRAPSAPPPPLQPVRHGRVLVVDDNVDAAMTLAEAVSLDGHEVQTAHDGNAALALAPSFAPDVVLLDIGLPGIDGYEVARRMRKLPGVQDALLIALTGFGQQSDRERALAAGFDDHLVKPVELAAVYDVLRKRLGSA